MQSSSCFHTDPLISRSSLLSIKSATKPGILCCRIYKHIILLSASLVFVCVRFETSCFRGSTATSARIVCSARKITAGVVRMPRNRLPGTPPTSWLIRYCCFLLWSVLPLLATTLAQQYSIPTRSIENSPAAHLES